MFGLGFFPFWDCPIRYPLSVSLGLVLFQRILEGIYSFCISTPPYVAFCNYLSPHLLHLLCGNRRNQERCPYACAISQYAALMLLSIQYNCTGHYSLWCMYPSRDVAVTDRYTAYICNKTDLFSFGHHTCSKLPCVLFLLRQQSLEWVEDVESRGRLIHSMVF